MPYGKEPEAFARRNYHTRGFNSDGKSRSERWSAFSYSDNELIQLSICFDNAGNKKRPNDAFERLKTTTVRPLNLSTVLR